MPASQLRLRLPGLNYLYSPVSAVAQSLSRLVNFEQLAELILGGEPGWRKQTVR